MDKKTILLVDDEPAVLCLMGQLFDERYTTIKAKNGTEALQAAAKPNSRIDLVLSDIDLGDLNGIRVMEQIRVHNPEIPYILMSARMEEYQQEAVNAGVNKYLSKPVANQELRDAVNDLLRE